MNNPLEQAWALLKEQELTCAVVCPDGRTLQSKERGIKPVLDLLRQDAGAIRGASAADKVVGKAAAMLFVHGGIQELHTDVISTPALAYLEEHHIPTAYETCVPHIINRDGTDMCPMEKWSLPLERPEDAFALFDSIIP